MKSKVLVIGDIMLDTYVYGSVRRISPEAPVPVLLKEEVSESLGGAGNVIANLSNLNLSVSFLGVLGSDSTAEKIKKLLDQRIESEDSFIFQKERYVSINKTRFIGQGLQMLRLDHEQVLKLENNEKEKIIHFIDSSISKFELVVISDYGKGLLSKQLIQYVIELCLELDIPVICDPKGDIDLYHNATIVTPNELESEQIEGESIKAKLITMRDVHRIKYPIITLGYKGIAYLQNGDVFISPAVAKDVFDVTGAGDTVVATICKYILDTLESKRFEIKDCLHVANKCAAHVVEKRGCVPILFDEYQQSFASKNSNKIVFTNGCFDILHLGHVQLLQKAKTLGSKLVVGLNSDDSVRRLKGDSRPVNDETARKAILESLSIVDEVIIFNEDTPLNLIKKLSPDIIVKGGDYTVEEVVGHELVDDVYIFPIVESFSTTNILKKSNEVN